VLGRVRRACAYCPPPPPPPPQRRGRCARVRVCKILCVCVILLSPSVCECARIGSVLRTVRRSLSRVVVAVVYTLFDWLDYATGDIVCVIFIITSIDSRSRAFRSCVVLAGTFPVLRYPRVVRASDTLRRARRRCRSPPPPLLWLWAASQNYSFAVEEAASNSSKGRKTVFSTGNLWRRRNVGPMCLYGDSHRVRRNLVSAVPRHDRRLFRWVPPTRNTTT